MDVFFNPSITETFGNVTLEAMAAGVPVVAARATGAVDLIDEGVTGFLVPPRAVDGYSRALEPIVGDPALHRPMGTTGTARAAGSQWATANQEVLFASSDVQARTTGLTLPVTPTITGPSPTPPRHNANNS